MHRLKKEKNALERAILGHYERLNNSVEQGLTESEYTEVQEQIRDKE